VEEDTRRRFESQIERNKSGCVFGGWRKNWERKI